MNWQIIATLLLGIVILYTLCFFGATIELELHKRKEARKWQDWADKRRKKK